jgi:hypothetical protein
VSAVRCAAVVRRVKMPFILLKTCSQELLQRRGDQNKFQVSVCCAGQPIYLKFHRRFGSQSNMLGLMFARTVCLLFLGCFRGCSKVALSLYRPTVYHHKQELRN